MYFGDVLNSGGGVCAFVNCFDGGSNSLQVCKELLVCPLAGVLEVTGLVAPPLYRMCFPYGDCMSHLPP